MKRNDEQKTNGPRELYTLIEGVTQHKANQRNNKDQRLNTIHVISNMFGKFRLSKCVSSKFRHNAFVFEISRLLNDKE